jgi:hypothetical protein
MAEPDVEPELLAGGNPRIAKGDGDEPVRAYIRAMPGWKHDVGQQLDALVGREVPHVRRAVRWNSPFYGVEGQGWFVSYHCFTRYVKVTFFEGASLDPTPPERGTDERARSFHIREGDEIDERLMATWIARAAANPGWQGF